MLRPEAGGGGIGGGGGRQRVRAAPAAAAVAGCHARARRLHAPRRAATENRSDIGRDSFRVAEEAGGTYKHFTKSVQTDIQNIDSELVQYDVQPFSASRNKLTSRSMNNYSGYYGGRYTSSYRAIDQRYTSADNALTNPTFDMDKPKGILTNRRTGSPRQRYTSEMHPSSAYPPTSFLDGFSYSDRHDDLDRERLKRENYQRDLRLQIDEKRRFQVMREDQERRERDLENKRLEQQLLRMREEQEMEEARRNRTRDEQLRRNSEDLLHRKRDVQGRGWRRRADSEGGSIWDDCPTSSRLPPPHYSPPVARRGFYTSTFSEPPLSTSRYTRYDSYVRDGGQPWRPEPLGGYDTVPTASRHRPASFFSRFDSLSRIDALTQRLDSMAMRDCTPLLGDMQRRHSATQQDLSNPFCARKSPKLRRRSNSSGRFDDSLPVPMLKAKSPVAKELRHAIPFSSGRHSDALRRLEDKWQIPAVQKTIVNNLDSPASQPGGRGVLTQIGAIRMQLQQEQLRLDETLHPRRTNPRAVDFH